MSRVIRALALLVLLVAVAGAQPSAQVRTKAAAHWKQGKAFYDSQQWDHAITEFTAAWELVKEPELLFSIALAHQKKGDLPAALAHYRQYVELSPNGAAADEAREYIAKITAELDRAAAERAAADVAKAKADAEEAERRRREAAEAARKKAEADAEVTRRQREARLADRERNARTLKWAGIGAGGGGIILVGVGIKFGLDAQDASDAISAHTAGEWPDSLLARQEEGRSAEKRMFVLTGIGGALVVTGAIVYVLGMRTSAAVERERTMLSVGPGDIGLGLVTRF